MGEATQVRVARSHDSAVHGSLSVQSVSLLQQPACVTCVQVFAALLQASIVQLFPSSQSPFVLQHPDTAVYVHRPVATSHASVVQGSLSVQSVSAWQQPVIGS